MSMTPPPIAEEEWEFMWPILIGFCAGMVLSAILLSLYLVPNQDVPYRKGMKTRVAVVMAGLAILSALVMSRPEPKNRAPSKAECAHVLAPGESC